MTCLACRARNDDQATLCATCGEPLPLRAGSVLAERYEVRALLGRGGMGAVYRAHDRVVDEEVALKVLTGAAGSDEGARRLRSEIRLARQVTHPNVCRIHDCGEDGDLRWISMELVRGDTVRDLLQGRGPFEAARAWDVAVQVAEGLAAVHRAGVVHRDLKTVNLTVDRAGRVRVMDFGIATPAASGDTGESGYLLGSPEYISPEQARGRPADARSDVYALGIVVFELFTGVVPFRAETPVATLLLHLEAAPPLDQERLPPALRPVLARALAKDPERRFATAGDMADALRAARGAWLAGSGATRHRRGRPRLVATLLAVAVVTAWLVATLTRPPAATTAPPPSPPASPTPATAAPPSDAPSVATGAGQPPPGAASPLEAPPLGGPSASDAGEPSSLAAPAAPKARDERPSPVSLSPGTDALDHGAAVARSEAAVGDTLVGEGAHEGDSDRTDTASAGGAGAGAGAASDSRPAESAVSPGAAARDVETAVPTNRPTERAAAAQASGALLVVVRPWADVIVDGVPTGQTPLAAIALDPGPHQVLLTHPDFKPFPRRVTIRPGETLRLVVDLPLEGVRRPR